jgi:hypothetical protein
MSPEADVSRFITARRSGEVLTARSPLTIAARQY